MQMAGRLFTTLPKLVRRCCSTKPLMHVWIITTSGAEAIVKTLLKLGANPCARTALPPSVKSGTSFSPLDLACGTGNQSLIRLVAYDMRFVAYDMLGGVRHAICGA
jgi:hypothetical protein